MKSWAAVPTESLPQTVCSLTALICVDVGIVCSFLHLLHMNHDAVMVSAPGATIKNIRFLSVFKCIVTNLFVLRKAFHDSQGVVL